MFCVKCGKKTKDIIDGLCVNCFSKTDILKIKPIKIKVCKNCGAFWHRGTWKDIELDDFLNEIIYENLTIKGELNLKIQNIDSDFGHEEKELPIRIHGKIGLLDSQKQSDITYRDSFNLEWKFCDRCMKIKGKKVEATLQIRSKRKFDGDRAEIIEKVSKEAEKIGEKNRMAFIIDIIELKEGIDIEFSSKKVARQIAGSLKKQYGGYLKESSKLVGIDRMSSKRIFKSFISLRLPKYRVGDILLAKEDVFKVTSIGGDGISLYDILHKKKVKYPWNRFEKMNFKPFKNIKKCVVTAIAPTKIYVMDEDYKTIELSKEEEFAVGEKAKLLNLKDRIILIKNEK